MQHLDNLRGVIASVSMDDIRAAVLKDEIVLAESRLQPHDTGHIHTTISTLEERVQEINKQIEDNKLDEPIDAHDG